MNILPFEQQVAIIGALTEGASIRAVERLTGIHRDTIMRLAARVGLGAIKFHDRTVHSLQVARIELDECWSFVGKKQRRCKAGEPAKGDQYIFVALAATAKAILSFRVGKRDLENTIQFAADLRDRVWSMRRKSQPMASRHMGPRSAMRSARAARTALS